MDTGWIRLHRSMVDWGWYTDTNTKVVFLHLLFIANWRDREYRGYKINKGDAVIGVNALAEQLNLSVRQVRTALEHLKSTGEITVKATNKFSIVTVENWAKYQLECDQSDKQATNKRQSKNDVFDGIGEKTTSETTNNRQAELLGSQGFADSQEQADDKQPTNNRQTTDKRPTTPKERKNIRNNNISIVIDIWNSICVDFPKVIKATQGTTRYKAINARWNEYGEDGIRETFEKVQQSAFLKGESESGWQATFDWVMKPNNFIKVKEGNYDNKIKRHSESHDHDSEWDNILFG